MMFIMTDHAAYQVKSRKEKVAIVDEKNQVIGSDTRENMRSHGLIHRATYILVFNSKGQIFVQKRTMIKDIFPGYYDLCAGGVVQTGETNKESAIRELEEELGISDVAIKFLFEFYGEYAGSRVWGSVYTCIYDGQIRLQEEEIEEGAFYSIEEVLTLAQRENCTPDGLYVLRRYLSDHCERSGN